MRYFFNVRSDGGFSADEEGGEFADLGAARDEANAVAREFAADDLRRGSAIKNRTIEIADRSGALLGSVIISGSLFGDA